MAFDPMTGEPIEEDDSLKFDPMTGEPIGQQPEQNMAEDSAVGGFDPMTGEPIRQQLAPEPTPVQETGGFDPMTGAPIGRQPEPTPVQETGGFDPMTGAPIGQQPTPTPMQEAGGFDPMTGAPIGQQPTPAQPLQGKGKQKSKLPAIVGGVAAFVVIAVLAVVIVSSVVMGKAGKVTLAAANTFKDAPHFVDALEQLSILQGDKYTVSFSCDVYNVSLDGEMRNSDKEKQVSMKLSSNGEKLDVLAGVDSKALKVQIPALSKYVFVYKYTGKNTGYLMDEADEDDIESFNTMLSTITDQKRAKNIYSDLYTIFKDELKNIKFVNAEKEEYEINDKDVNCKGYTATITAGNMIHIADKIEKLVKDKYVSVLETADVSIDEFEKEIEDLKDDLEDIDDIELTFYVYKNKLAAIILENPEEDVKIELCFQGGDYRMQNMLLKADDYRIRVTGSDNGTKEKFVLRQRRNGGNETEIGSLEYNYDSGKFSFDTSGVTVEGKLNSSKSELNLKISDIRASYYSVSPDLDITIKKGSKMDKFDGKEFDIGNADKDEYMDLMDDVRDKVYDGDFNSLLRALGLN